MPVDATIPLGIQTPQPMAALSSVVGAANGIQGYRNAQLAGQSQAMVNQQSSIDLQETQAAQQVMKAAPRDADGNIDLNKLSPMMAQAAPKNYATFMSNIAAAQNSANVAKRSWLAATDDQRTQFGKIATSLVGQPPDVVMKTLDAARSSPAFSGMTPSIDHFVQTGVAPAWAAGDQKSLDDALYRIGKMAEAPSTQQAMNTPGGIPVSNGQQSSVVSTKPGTPIALGSPIPGTVQQQQLPPTTPVVNPDGSMSYLGSQGQGGPAVFDLSGDKVRDLGMLNSIANDPKQPTDIRAQARAQLAQVQTRPASSLPPGQATNMENNVGEMNRHYAGLNDAASGAQLIQGLTGNIKALTNVDTAGTGAGKKAWLSGMLEALHIPSTGDLQRDADLLEKNMAQLNLGTPATTDAARTLVAAARPHSSMNPEAVKEAADQVASQVKANMAMRNALTGYKMMGDVQGYTAARAKLEQVADPRVWQFEALSAPEQAKFLAKLTPDDRSQLRDKIVQLQQMGLIK